MIPDPENISAFSALVLDAYKDKNFGALLALGLIAITFMLRKYGSKVHPKVEAFLKSDPGGILSVFISSFGVALFASTVGGVKLDNSVLLAAGKAALTASGGFSVIYKFILPVVKRLLKINTGEQAAAQIRADTSAKAAADAEANKEPAAASLSEIE